LTLYEEDVSEVDEGTDEEDEGDWEIFMKEKKAENAVQ
jgi:hypothetical protein